MTEFVPWPKTPRLFRDMIITEKIDGTNAAVVVTYVPDGPSPEDYWDESTMTRLVQATPDGWDYPGEFIVQAQSRSRLITPAQDNHGFAQWVFNNAANLAEHLGEGRHFGEWWGNGIQRGYGLPNGDKRFSLFNVNRYADLRTTPGLGLVPVLYEGPFSTHQVEIELEVLREFGSQAAPGFAKPEGVVVYHKALNGVFKATIEGDGVPKGQANG